MGYTSTEVKRRYNEKVYKQLNVQIPRDLYEQFKESCELEETPVRQVLIRLIEDYIGRK